MRIFFLAIAFFCVSAIFPLFSHIFAIFVSIIALGIFTLRLIASLFPRKQLHTTKNNTDAFISIHVPIHNEPPLLVKNTLRALAALDYMNYEVLVVDNNTANPALWKPVQDYCSTLGGRFHFFHVENLSGYKAGALNYLSAHIDPRTKYVAVVDADYAVQPHFLTEAVRYFTDHVALVQFPQSYSNAGANNRGIVLDYEYFFASFMNMGNHLHGVSSTGTLSVVSVEALQKLGQWDEEVLTEDIELGLRLNVLGYEGVYVDKIIGQGVMPYDLSSLRKQRSRWSFGNAQTLRKHFGSLYFSRTLSVGQRLALTLQLTAWFDFDALLCIIALSVLPLWLITGQPIFEATIAVASLAVLLSHAVQFISFFITLRKRRYSYRDICTAYLIRLAFLWISGTTWIRAFSQQRATFVHTNKFLSDKNPRLRQRARSEVVMSSALFFLGLTLLSTHLILAIMLLAVGMSALSILFAKKQAIQTRRYSAQVLQKIEQSFAATTV